MSQVINYAQLQGEAFRAELRDWLKIPSISTLPDHATAVQQAAQWLADNMATAGLENIAILPTGGHPVVYADWLNAGENAPTVLVYGHYDVQPAEKSDGWITEPFEPVEREGKLYARGASDDKGQTFIHVKMVESFLKTAGKLPVNIKFIVEGEEEIGSPNLPRFMNEQRDRLAADICIISDSPILSADQPSITYAMRGLVQMEIEVTGPAMDLHSGLYGGTVHNPIVALSSIIAQFHNPDGRVAVPGFYDDVLPLADEERSELGKTPWEMSEWQGLTGAKQPWGEPGYSLRERVGARPTLELNGIVGGFHGAGNKTVLPAKALAKVSCRLVANQRPDKIYEQIRSYVRQIAPPTVHIEVRKLAGQGDPGLIDINDPGMRAAVRAYEAVWGKSPVFIREGGTLPILPLFESVLQAPVIMLGFGLPGDNLHGPNENLAIMQFHRGIETAIHYVNEVATAQ